MPNRSAAATWNDDAWDDTWAAFDARQPAVAPRPVTVPVQPAKRPTRARRWLGLAALAVALPAAWFAGPVLVAGEVLRGLERQDAAALSARIDWAVVTPTLATAFRDVAGREHGPGAARFLDRLAGDMAAAWDRPEARAHVLAGRALQPAGLQSTRIDGYDRVVLDLGAEAGLPSMSLTLSLTEPTRLGWAITGLRFAEAAAPPGAIAPAPLRPVMVAF